VLDFAMQTMEASKACTHCRTDEFVLLELHYEVGFREEPANANAFLDHCAKLGREDRFKKSKSLAL
jgi:hypothetical protein